MRRMLQERLVVMVVEPRRELGNTVGGLWLQGRLLHRRAVFAFHCLKGMDVAGAYARWHSNAHPPSAPFPRFIDPRRIIYLVI